MNAGLYELSVILMFLNHKQYAPSRPDVIVGQKIFKPFFFHSKIISRSEEESGIYHAEKNEQSRKKKEHSFFSSDPSIGANIFIFRLGAKFWHILTDILV